MTHAHIYGAPRCTCSRCNGQNPAYVVTLAQLPTDAVPAFPRDRALLRRVFATARAAFGTDISGLTHVSAQHAIMQRTGDPIIYAVRLVGDEPQRLGYVA